MEEIKQASAALRMWADKLDSVKTTEEWHPSTDIPEEGLYIVATSTGAIFVSQPIGGKWFKQIRWWRRMPPLPES